MVTKNNLKIGSLLRQLRKENRMTGSVLAKKTGLSQSKISKLETGKHSISSTDDIERILNILRASKTIQQQVHALLETAHFYTSRREQYRIQAITDPSELEKEVQHIRVHTTGMLPALLNTVDYRIGYLTRIGTPSELIDGLVKDLIKRQDRMWDDGRKMTAIINEAALYTLVVDRRAQLAQLDRLERLLLTAHTKIGIIPLEAGLATVENGPFCLHDERFLMKALAEGEMRTRDRTGIALYLSVFSELEDKAWFGDEAKRLIRKAVDYIS